MLLGSLLSLLCQDMRLHAAQYDVRVADESYPWVPWDKQPEAAVSWFSIRVSAAAFSHNPPGYGLVRRDRLTAYILLYFKAVRPLALMLSHKNPYRDKS